jgi:circadian clock protein KaiC
LTRPISSIDNRITSGSEGLDSILRGGLPFGRLYLIEGAPGCGKTTLALQFLLEGVKQGERCLYITLSESDAEMHAVAASHGWSLQGIDLFELASAQDAFGQDREQTIFHPWELELSRTVGLIQAEVERVKPTRVVFDSLSELRLLAQDPLRYRRQVLALKHFFANRNATVVLVDDITGLDGLSDNHLHSLCHGVITLERFTLAFGAARRRLQVQKLRGVDFLGGYHDFTIRKGGLDVFPRLVAAEHHTPSAGEPTSSGIPELDALLGGGPLRGTSTLITGPAGTGKTTLAMQFLSAACERGERCVLYQFDERVDTLLLRAEAMGLPIPRYLESGLLQIVQIDPAEVSPGEFASLIRRQVERRQVRVVVFDSLNGYLSAMPEEQQLILQMHELLSYLNQKGVVTLLLNPQAGLMGTMGTGNLNISYMSDCVVLIRFFEAAGRIRKAISIIKNRGGWHEDNIRELRIDSRGIRVGEPLTDFIGVLTGTPEYTGDRKPLMEDRGGP